MADKLPGGIFVYFIFLFVMLVGITILAVQVLISTATRIGDIRDAILATTTIAETHMRIAQYKDMLTEIEQLIIMEADNASLNLNQSLQEFTEVTNTHEIMKQRLNMAMDWFEVNRTRWSRNNFSKRFGLNRCINTISNLTELLSLINQLNQEVNDYVALDRFQTAYRAINTVLLPDGVTIYGPVDFDPNSTVRPLRLVPNSNDYLASYGAQTSPNYLASPVLADYLRLSVAVSVNPDDPLVMFISQEGDNSSINQRISIAHSVENPFLVFNYDLESYFIVPYEVYSQSARKLT